MAELTTTGLRVLVAVAERGSFTAAAAVLGYTQSAVSRQVATLEAAAGQSLFDRHRAGVTLTAAGSRLLPRAARIVADLDAALSDVASGTAGRVRFGTFPMAAAGLVPPVLAALAEVHPDVVVTVRESSTTALVRSVRAGTLDVAMVAQTPPYRPLDAESPALDVTTLLQRDLVVAVGPGHPLARRRAVEVEELEGRVWVAGPADDEAQLGVWPGSERARGRAVRRARLAHQAAFRLGRAGADHRLSVAERRAARRRAAAAGARRAAGVSSPVPGPSSRAGGARGGGASSTPSLRPQTQTQ